MAKVDKVTRAFTVSNVLVALLCTFLLFTFPAGIFLQSELLVGASFAAFFLLLFGDRLIPSRMAITTRRLIEWMIWVAVFLAISLPGESAIRRASTGAIAVAFGTAAFFLTHFVASNLKKNLTPTVRRTPED